MGPHGNLMWRHARPAQLKYLHAVNGNTLTPPREEGGDGGVFVAQEDRDLKAKHMLTHH